MGPPSSQHPTESHAGPGNLPPLRANTKLPGQQDEQTRKLGTQGLEWKLFIGLIWDTCSIPEVLGAQGKFQTFHQEKVWSQLTGRYQE